MANVRCPNCGKDNPDLLDVCQFCLTPLKPESVLRIGEGPTKKNTGELEPVLPDWLKDVRQQARDSAEEDAAQAANRPQAPKDEPLDLLAGLASQTSSSEDEVPDWLASIAPPAESKTQDSSAPTAAQKPDFFTQFDKSRSESGNEPAQEASPASTSEEKDELSDWLAQAARQPEETVEPHHDAAQIDGDWVGSFDTPVTSTRETAPREEEDLSWLRNLEETAKQTGDLKAPKLETDWTANFEAPSTPSEPASPEDLSWLDRLGGIAEPSQPPFEQAPSSRNEPGWLNQLGGLPAEQPLETPEAKPPAQEDLSWLNNLGGASEPVQPFDAAPDRPIAAEPFASGEDLDWLSNIGETPEAVQPFDVSAADASRTPHSAEAETPARIEDQKEKEPDWLKDAAEAPSMPAPGDISMDWFSHADEHVDQQQAEPAATPQPAPFTDIFSTPGDASPPPTQDLDSLFSAEMPDWLSRPEPEAAQSASAQPVSPPPGSEDSLTPGELPSWVQAMRPMEALISESAPSSEDEPEEKEGPLAGLRGVIPGAPIDSSIRPKALSLKLQVSPEQQTSAALLEQILGGETSPRALADASFIAAQHVLRWVLAGLFLVVLGVAISLRSQSMPVSASLPLEGSSLASAVLSIPANSKVLVVVDYEPSLAGEMEAIGSPLLDQMVSLGRPNLSFVSTSPAGPALVERLLTSARINTVDGFGYQAGGQYRNLGFLPGGSAGVLGFVQQPGSVVSGADVGAFSEYGAVVVMTDHAESGRIWVEQLQSQKQLDFALANQPLLIVASAQAGPLLQPYVSSGQVDGMISGLSDAARYEARNGRAGAARLYWDSFGVGLAMSIVVIIVGSLWSLLTGIRARRAQADQG